MQIQHCNASAHSYTDKGHITDILEKQTSTEKFNLNLASTENSVRVNFDTQSTETFLWCF